MFQPPQKALWHPSVFLFLQSDTVIVRDPAGIFTAYACQANVFKACMRIHLHQEHVPGCPWQLGFFIAFQRFSPEIRPWSSTDVHPGFRRFLAKIVSILVTSASVTNSCFRNYRKPCLHQYFQGFSLFIFSGAFPQNPTRKRLTASLTKFLAPKLFPSSVATKFLSAFIPCQCRGKAFTCAYQQQR